MNTEWQPIEAAPRDGTEIIEQQKLREAVARSLAIAMGQNPDEPQGDPYCESDNGSWPLWAEYQKTADAAIAACRPFHRAEALEEAARVAEGNGLRQYTGKPLIDEIAAAIRALIPSSADPSAS